MADKALIISKLTGGGSHRPSDVDFARVADVLRLFGGRTRDQYARLLAGAGTDGQPDAGTGLHADGERRMGGGDHHLLPAALYGSLLDHRAQLQNTALAAVRALLDYDEQVMAHVMCRQAETAPSGLAEAIRASAPLIACKGDWAALYMLLQERGMGVGYTELCRLIARHAPDAPQPRKQDIAGSEWDTGRRRFPDWQPQGLRYDKFRRHYLIAQTSAEHLSRGDAVSFTKT